MKHLVKIAITAALVCSWAAPSLAAEISGAEVGVDFSRTGEANDNIQQLGLWGSLNVGFSPKFSIQGDMALYNERLSEEGDEDFDFDIHTFELHGIYHLIPGTSLGGFVGISRPEHGTNQNYYGLEFGRKIYQISYEIYGWRSNNEDKFTAFGVQTAYALNERLSLGNRFELYNPDQGPDRNRIGVTVDYKLAPGYSLYGELGRLHENSDSDVNVKLGIRAYFGSGATFSQHGLTSLQ